MNLIKNFNFQDPYHFPSEGNEDVRIVRGLDLIPFRAPNLRVPTDFLCFTCDDGKYVTVEMGIGETPERLFNGHTSCKYFVAGHPHDAGLAQTLQLEAGTYQYRVWVHGWSNHNIPVSDEYKYCNNDGLCTSGVGRGPYFELEGTIGERDGVPWNDAKFNMLWSLGVTMGEFVSPHSDHVKWGVGAYVYNVFHELPLLEFIVEKAGLVTVYVRSITEWQFRNADGYVGEMELVRVGDAGKCKGEPREQYKRTYVLTPPGMVIADQHRLRDIFPNYTIGPSADDAGLGALDDKTVIAVDPYKWTNPLQDFFAQYYPGTIYKEYILNPGQPSKLLFWQCDPRWKNEKLAGYACTQTLCQTGCWISCCASAMVKLGIDPNATPHTVNQALGTNGFTGCLTNWSAMESKLQLHVEKSTTNEYEASLWMDGQPDHCAFAEVQPGAAMHFIFVEKYDDDGGFYCHDPYRNVSAELYSLYPGGAESWRLIRKAGSTPPPPPPPPPTTSAEIISLHIQGDIPKEFDWLAWIERYQPAAVKLVEGWQRCKDIKARSPNTKVFLRRHHDNQGRFWEHPDGPEAGAELFLATFGEDPYNLAPWIDGIEGMNEVIATGAPTVQQAIDFELAFGKLLQARGLPPLCSPNAGVGNIGHDVAEIERFLPLVQHIVDTNGHLGAHLYTGCRKDGYRSYVDNFIHYAGRPLLSWDPIFNAHGLYPNYLGTEGGAIYIASNGSMPFSNAGWKYPDTLNNLEEYVEVLRQLRRKYIAWNRAHGWRLLVYELFTYGANDWQYFVHNAYAMSRISIMIEEERAAGWK